MYSSKNSEWYFDSIDVINSNACRYIIGCNFNWHIQAISAGVIPLIGFAMLYFVPESPYYLMEKNDVKGSIKSLCWLRGAQSSDLIENEIREVNNKLQQF